MFVVIIKQKNTIQLSCDHETKINNVTTKENFQE